MVGDGRGPKPGSVKPPQPALKRRRAKVVEWTLAGYSVEAIARSLRPPIHSTSVSADRTAMRYKIGAARVVAKGRLSRPDPEPYDWMTPPLAPPRPGYKLDAPMDRIESFLRSLRDLNARAKLPFNVAEAESAGDAEWFMQSQVVLIDTIRYLRELLDILQISEARLAAMQPAARDDLADPTRQMHRPHRLQVGLAPANRAGTGSPLPPKGSGIEPARVFQVLMGWHWAGRDLSSDEVIERVVQRENASVQRVIEAAGELKTALKSAGWE